MNSIDMKYHSFKFASEDFIKNINYLIVSNNKVFSLLSRIESRYNKNQGNNTLI